MPALSVGGDENEFHFLIDCPKYDVLRNKFYSSVYSAFMGKWNLKDLDSDLTFFVLMSGIGDQDEKLIFRMLHSYLVKCFSLRGNVRVDVVGSSTRSRSVSF